MKKINRAKFFPNYNKQFGKLNQSQVDGLNKFISFLENDKHIIDIRWASYMMATVHHETGQAWIPVRERGTSEYFIKRYSSQTKVGKILGNDTPREGEIYKGRGYAQDTGETNYERNEKVIRKEYPDVVERFEKRTGKKFDLTVGDQLNDMKDPDNMLDDEIAYCAISINMRNGYYTGVGLPKYINNKICDYYNARKIINGLDCADMIANYAKKFQRILDGSDERTRNYKGY